MTDDEFESYKAERYNIEIGYYENRAKRNKTYYHLFQWIVIVLSASVPVLASLINDKNKIITVIVSIVLAIGTTALKTFKFQENWLNFCAVAETLKKELYYYNASIEGYEERENKNGLFVERVESLISREHSLWIGRNKPSAIEKKGE
jgi:hypothetical protein